VDTADFQVFATHAVPALSQGQGQAQRLRLGSVLAGALALGLTPGHLVISVSVWRWTPAPAASWPTS